MIADRSALLSNPVMPRTQLQLALDFVRLDEALSVAERAAEHVDLLEAGTPLIKTCGLEAVRRLKRRFPHRGIVADLKTMDTGFLEAEMAYRAGADAVTVLGAAARETIAGAVEAAREFERMVVVDSIGIEDTDGLLLKIEGLNVDWLLIHTGIDQQQAGGSPFAHLDRVAGRAIEPRLGVVGGLDASTVGRLHRYPGIELAVVGGAITKAGDPRAAAAQVRAALDQRPSRRLG